jgi:hypothetical protein
MTAYLYTALIAWTVHSLDGGVAGTAAAIGAEGGPIVLFDSGRAANSTGTGGAALVLSPLSNFKSTQLGPALDQGAGGAAAAAAGGVSSYVTSLPANFTASFCLFVGVKGVTDAVHGWGSALQGVYNTTRLPDPASTLLTYWTDNGGRQHGRG